MQGIRTNKEGHNLLDHGCQMVPFGHAYIYLSGRSVRKLIGKFFIDRRRVISVNIRVYLLIITDKLKTLPIVDDIIFVP